jgi:hypothetical protein
MKNRLFTILISLFFVAAINADDTMGQVAGPPDISVSVALLDENDDPSNAFLLDEQINVVISLENVGSEAVFTSEGFSTKDFHLQLQFYDPNGDIITATHPTGLPDPPPPRVQLIQGELIQVEMVEVLPVGWLWAVEPFDAHDFYALTQGGSYSVKALIAMRTYPQSALQTISGTTYAALSSSDWSGKLESNSVNFTLIADVDADNYYYPVAYGIYPEADCDDTNAQVNPGASEKLDNGLDDDCNPQTADKYEVVDGIIQVLVEKHTVDKKKKSKKEPVVGLTIRAYDKSQGSCLKENYGVSPKNYEPVWWSCNPAAAMQETDKNGIVNLSVAPGEYVVIGAYPPGEAVAREDREYIGVSAGGVESGEKIEKYLQLKVKK